VGRVADLRDVYLGPRPLRATMAMQPSPEQMAQMMAGSKPVDFEIIGGEEPVIRVKVTDEGKEVILRLKVVVGAVNRLGNDQNTGLPIYQINTQTVIGLLKSDPALRKSPVLKGSAEGNKGFG
jgi:hypothetical protein